MQRLDKRSVLEQILATHGPQTILVISDAAPQLPPEPVVVALRKAGTVPDLLDRWGRMETFSHARHCVKITLLEEGVYQLRHTSKDGASYPVRSETLVVLGLITKLCEELGAKDVSLRDRTGCVWREDGRWIPDAECVAVDEVILTALELGSTEATHSIPTQDTDGLRQTIVQDPVRRWTLKSLAERAGTSERTLQRRLANHASSFSQIVSEARLQVAADHLCAHESPSLAEIGFLSGYADQAHFTRAFKAGVGTTPDKYRSEFR